jgi:Fe-S-cluster containining protein
LRYAVIKDYQRVSHLVRIQNEIHHRCDEIVSAHGGWPCQKGCDDCCRHLASAPRITRDEWLPIATAIHNLPEGLGEAVRGRIRTSVGAQRPVTCPLLDTSSGACLVYDVRPIACRAYGFYAERREVLGCNRIWSVSTECPDIIWGNHAALQQRVELLGEEAELSDWLDFDSGDSRR